MLNSYYVKLLQLFAEIMILNNISFLLLFSRLRNESYVSLSYVHLVSKIYLMIVCKNTKRADETKYFLRCCAWSVAKGRKSGQEFSNIDFQCRKTIYCNLDLFAKSRPRYSRDRAFGTRRLLGPPENLGSEVLPVREGARAAAGGDWALARAGSFFFSFQVPRHRFSFLHSNSTRIETFACLRMRQAV